MLLSNKIIIFAPVKNVNQIGMKQILYVVAAVLMLGLGACKSKQTITSVPVETEVAPVEEETRAESFELVETDAEVVPTDYFVVVGSFKSISNAKGLQATLQQEGIQAIIAINEQQMYRVIYASFDNYEDARVQRDALRGRFADAWILVQK